METVRHSLLQPFGSWDDLVSLRVPWPLVHAPAYGLISDPGVRFEVDVTLRRSFAGAGQTLSTLHYRNISQHE